MRLYFADRTEIIDNTVVILTLTGGQAGTAATVTGSPGNSQRLQLPGVSSQDEADLLADNVMKAALVSCSQPPSGAGSTAR